MAYVISRALRCKVEFSNEIIDSMSVKNVIRVAYN
jgi:hypothetical protein